MAAVLAKGKTTIYNAACEPYIQQLSKMLKSMPWMLNFYAIDSAPLYIAYPNEYLDARVKIDSVELSLFQEFPYAGVSLLDGEIFSNVTSKDY